MVCFLADAGFPELIGGISETVLSYRRSMHCIRLHVCQHFSGTTVDRYRN